jgi:hypothetical protein
LKPGDSKQKEDQKEAEENNNEQKNLELGPIIKLDF